MTFPSSLLVIGMISPYNFSQPTLALIRTLTSPQLFGLSFDKDTAVTSPNRYSLPNDNRPTVSFFILSAFLFHTNDTWLLIVFELQLRD